MRRIFSTVLLAVLCAGMVLADESNKPAFQIADNTFFDPSKKEVIEDPYVFSVSYRVEAGYVQHWQRSQSNTFQTLYLQDGRNLGGKKEMFDA